MCLVSCGVSLARADDRALHNATSAPTTPSPSSLPTTASPISPYDPPTNDGRIEFGAAFGATIASDVRDLSATLMLGRFVTERLELGALASVARLEAGARSATLWSTVIEPAYHLPLTAGVDGVLGMGIGLAYHHQLGAGLAVAPRIGVRFVVGRHVVTPALAYTYVTHRALDADADLAVIGVTRALRLQLGYAIRW